MKVIKYIETDVSGIVPLVDIALMSDEQWNKEAIEDRKKNPKKYRDVALLMLTSGDLSETEKEPWIRILKERDM